MKLSYEVVVSADIKNRCFKVTETDGVRKDRGRGERKREKLKRGQFPEWIMFLEGVTL